ncbi:hypothetical protein C173_06642 [Paenibacillus sp. FSL R7-277]|nr:hypothetical protein C173_06642 [Paenibacillus sp. FSL R7-277]
MRIKPTTMGPGAARRLNVIEKPTILALTEACGANVIEKPTTMGPGAARRPNVIEKPTILALTEACGPNVIEKPTILGLTEACGPNVYGKTFFQNLSISQKNLPLGNGASAQPFQRRGFFCMFKYKNLYVAHNKLSFYFSLKRYRPLKGRQSRFHLYCVLP